MVVQVEGGFLYSVVDTSHRQETDLRIKMSFTNSAISPSPKSMTK